MKKQKILIVTARKAFLDVKNHLKDSRVNVEIHVCNADVASLLTPRAILRELSNKNLNDISMILVPGMIRGDVSIIEKKLKIPCVKGTKNASDLGLLLEKLYNNEIKLSTREPADRIILEERKKRAMKEIKNAYKLSGYRLKIGRKNPVYLNGEIPHIISEIVNAPSLSENELRRISRHYVDSGASIIDIGMIPGEENSEKIPRIIEILRSTVDVPLSIDTLNKEEILVAVENGIDLVLSIDETNYKICDSLEIPVVIIPRDKNGKIPVSADERISIIEKIINFLNKNNNIIVDPVLEIPNFGFINSLEAYIVFRKRYPEIPMLIGSGNLTEMIDADSIGINALIAAISSELGIDLIFTTEASKKTRGCVKELSNAIGMMYLSRKQKQPPKDLGVDLLYIKDKNHVKPIIDPREKHIETIHAHKDKKSEMEDVEFRIYLTDKINAVVYKDGVPKLRFMGRRASKIYKEIIGRNLIRNLYHAAYLGKELTKAEIALRLGKNYIQDEELFKNGL